MLAVVAEHVVDLACSRVGLAELLVAEVEVGGQELVDLVGESSREAMERRTEHMFVRYARGRTEAPGSTQEPLQVDRCPRVYELPGSGVGALTQRRPDLELGPDLFDDRRRELGGAGRAAEVERLGAGGDRFQRGLVDRA